MDLQTPPPRSAQPSEHHKHLRRSHGKSRTRCGNCKKRRIKVEAPPGRAVRTRLTRQCDETKPGCNNCRAFGAKLDYVKGIDTLQDGLLGRSTFLNTQGPRPRGKRGRPRTRWNTEQSATPSIHGLSSSRTDSTPLSSASVSGSAIPDPSNSPGYADEIRLLHQYLTRESEGSDNEPPTCDALRLQAPTLRLMYPFVFHLVYEFPALDLARPQPLGR